MINNKMKVIINNYILHTGLLAKLDASDDK